jgi:hypothetical protein
MIPSSSYHTLKTVGFNAFMYRNAAGDKTVNPDGSVIVDNGNGTYTETDADGSVTTYTNAGDVINSDGSVCHDNGDGTYTETGINGDVTTYTNNGIVFNASAGDTIVTDASGNQVVHHDNGNGSYTETEANGYVTYYTNNGIPFDPKTDSIKLDSNGNQVVDTPLSGGKFIETEADGTTTTYNNDGTVASTSTTPTKNNGGAGAGKPTSKSNVDANNALNIANQALKYAQLTKDPTKIAAAKSNVAAAQQKATKASIILPIAITLGVVAIGVIAYILIKKKKK